MKKHIYVPLFLFILSFIPISVLAQKGEIKIYSELKGIEVYLDEAFMGIDIMTIDSIAAGSHYLKVIKEDAVIYGEIVSINPGNTTAVLIKDTKEVRDKIAAAKQSKQDELIAGKTVELAQYKSQKLGVKTNTRYITETSTTGQSQYNSFYHTTSGTANTVSETKAIEEWCLTQGDVPIADATFAAIINDQRKIDDVTAYNASIKSKRATKSLLGTLFLIGGLVAGANFIITLVDESRFAGGPFLLYLAGFTTGMMMFATKPQYRTISYDINEAREKAAIYNLDLKKKLGLPENYEP